jgi:hypothetical protein
LRIEANCAEKSVGLKLLHLVQPFAAQPCRLLLDEKNPDLSAGVCNALVFGAFL